MEVMVVWIIVLVAVFAIWIVWALIPSKKKKYTSNVSAAFVVEKIKEIIPCNHEWEEWGGPSNSRFEDKVFCCKKCKVIGFPKNKINKI